MPDNSLSEENNPPQVPKVMFDGGSSAVRAMPTASDMLICHSTVPGFFYILFKTIFINNNSVDNFEYKTRFPIISGS